MTPEQDIERMVCKSDIEMLLFYMQRDSPPWGDHNLARALVRIEYDYDIDLDDYISNEMLDYVHMYKVEDSIC